MKTFLDPRLKSLLRDIADEEPESYVVGGALRDYLMGEVHWTDLDIAVAGNGFLLSKHWADRHRASFVPLDDFFGTGRIVLVSEEPVTIDVSSFKGSDIRKDLRMRDFTVNALAVRVQDFLTHSMDRIVDVVDGRRDILSKTIRACSERSFHDDPLRILRAFRFAANLQFALDPATLIDMQQEVTRLAEISPERIRDELFALLAADSSIEALEIMDKAGVIEILFPVTTAMRGCTQNEFHHLDVWGHTLETVRQLEKLMLDPESLFGSLGPWIKEYLNDCPVKGRPRRTLLKMAALFHDSGKPESRFIDPTGRVRFFGHEKVSKEIVDRYGERLKLANRESSILGNLVEGHMRPTIFTGEQVTKRAVLRLCRRFGDDTSGLLLLFLADLAATRGPARTPESEERAREQVVSALEICFDTEQSPPKPLLSGHDIMDSLGLTPGPDIGRILKHIGELQDAGEVTTKEEALEAAAAMLNSESPARES
ncbi:CCA tRNA nucleotidyltransferase [Desulfomonile tiedjei]|uniref:tRNA nucleotidyltransferase/poly(A) polymerase n=1 Tax=Desulfomonile tiedjei (strain ATCC 49306 / DSM 6799 / DCB-1) TaxID=706587 RepID=I4C9I8_DESTA|nr:HD domain-containing protein [Desulfomonile tiedjei]AFM26229.1 tRNA nucleotidyltransferase/poly(A) polymerase [Desulfomonile tiedjei DSM 6799]